MAAPHTKTSSQRLARKEEVRQLLARRYTQEQVAAELGIKQATVSYWAEKIEADAQAAAADKAVEIRATLDSLAEVEREAWAAWERSKRPAEATVRVRGRGARGRNALVTRTRVGQAGEPSYLNGILAAQTHRASLIGI